MIREVIESERQRRARKRRMEIIYALLAVIEREGCTESGEGAFADICAVAAVREPSHLGVEFYRRIYAHSLPEGDVREWVAVEADLEGLFDVHDEGQR